MCSTPPAAVLSRQPSPTILPDEVLSEIFVKLPLKILLQLKCVCKSWKTLISDPQFARYQYQSHRSIMANERLAFFVEGNPSRVVTCSVQSLIETPSIPAETVEFTMRLERGYEIIGSCNGLLCLFDNSCCFRLWNPCTRAKSEKSPEAQGLRGEMMRQCGFGYDKVNDKYKVMTLVDVEVRVKKKGLQVKTVAKVYTFGESNWRMINGDVKCVIDSWDKYGQFANGNLHWLTKEATDQGKVIFTMDVENETCGQLLLPDLGGVRGDVSLHGTDDGLYVCQMIQFCWDLWLMKEYGAQESWTKFATIPLQHSPVTSCALLFFPLCILESGVFLMGTTCSHSHLVFRYDSNDGSFSHCMILRDQHGKNARVYHESLVPPP